MSACLKRLRTLALASNLAMAYAGGEQKSIMSILTLKEAQIVKNRSAVRSFVSEILSCTGEVVVGKTVSISSGHALMIDLRKVTGE